jgi:hypothetical protein
VVPASEKEAESWSAADKFTVVLETAGLNATELGGYCRVSSDIRFWSSGDTKTGPPDGLLMGA